MLPFDGSMVMKQLADERKKKKKDVKRIEMLERVLANITSTPSSDSGWDPEEEAWMGYTDGSSQERKHVD